MNEQIRIQLDDVSFTYEEAPSPALSHARAEIRGGEFVAVLGHNGSGKSTLAKLLNALYLPSEGKVVVCGYDTAREEFVWEIRRRAGMIFQNPDNQIVATVVREDVAFGLENLGVPTEEMIARVESALAAVQMSRFADSAPHLLSGGQKQRVAVAGILAMEPSVLIADEATAMLDPSGRKEVLDTIRSLNRRKGITVVWITHFMEEAALADRVLVVSDGKIVSEGTPAEVFRQVDRLRELHLDVPRMTALAAELRRQGMPLREGILTVEELAEEVRSCMSIEVRHLTHTYGEGSALRTVALDDVSFTIEDGNSSASSAYRLGKIDAGPASERAAEAHLRPGAGRRGGSERGKGGPPGPAPADRPGISVSGVSAF